MTGRHQGQGNWGKPSSAREGLSAEPPQPVESSEGTAQGEPPKPHSSATWLRPFTILRPWAMNCEQQVLKKGQEEGQAAGLGQLPQEAHVTLC